MSHEYSPAVVPPTPMASVLNPDYGAVDPQLVAWLEEQYETLQRLLARTAHDLVTIGRSLIEVKEGLAQQEFLAFVAALGLSRATAYRWMAAAEAAVGRSHIENVEPSALYALAAKSTPEDVREAFLERADAGHRVTLQEVQTMLRQRRPAAHRPAPNLVERLVDGIVEAEDVGAGRNWRGRDVRIEQVSREIARFEEESRAAVAAAVDAWGCACVEAAAAYLANGDGL